MKSSHSKDLESLNLDPPRWGNSLLRRAYRRRIYRRRWWLWWIYDSILDDHGISIFYEEVDGLFLSNVETENPETILFGAKVFELTIDEVINLMKENGYSDYEIEEIDLEDNEEEKGSGLFWWCADRFSFRRGKTSNINWGGAPLDDDDDYDDDDED